MKIIKNIQKDFKEEWRRKPINSFFMIAVVVLAVLTLFTNVMDTVWGKTGLSFFYFFILLIIIGGMVYFIDIKKLWK